MPLPTKLARLEKLPSSRTTNREQTTTSQGADHQVRSLKAGVISLQIHALCGLAFRWIPACEPKLDLTNKSLAFSRKPLLALKGGELLPTNCDKVRVVISKSV